MKSYKGGDASRYAEGVYGGINDQHAEVGGGNVIAMKPGVVVGGSKSLTYSTYGGRKRKSKRNMFSNFTNKIFQKIRKFRKSRKSRKSRRTRRRY
jgi:hypothetical protein